MSSKLLDMLYTIIESTVAQDGTRTNALVPKMFTDKREALDSAIAHGKVTGNHFLSADVVERSLGGSLFEVSGCCMGNYTFVACITPSSHEAH